MSKQTLQYTKDYSRFVFKEDNRLLDKSMPHIKAIAESMKTHGFIKSRAIIVRNLPNSTKLEVIDGQHRLKAAELAGVQVWFFIDNEISEEALPDLQIAKSWVPRDYVHHFVVKGKKNYIKLDEIIQKYPKVAITTILVLLSGAVRHDGYKKEFQAGKLSAMYLDETLVTLERMYELYLKYNYKWILTADFAMAFTLIQRHEGFDYGLLLDRLKVRGETFVQMVSLRGYFKLIAGIYNHGARTNKIAFRIPEED